MNFTYETQGAITYLVCELAQDDQIDTLTLGMLTNNHIAGFAPVLYTEMNGQRYLKYNISAKVTAEHFFDGTINKQRALTAFKNILNAICSADDYMIEQNCFSLKAEHIFLNVSSCETALLCIPVVNENDANAEIAALFKRIMFSTRFDSNEDASYIAKLIGYINNSASFTVYGLKNLVSELLSDTSSVAASAAEPEVPTSQQQSFVPAVSQKESQAPQANAVSPFDSTVSIDDMPGMMAQKQTQAPPQTQPNVAMPNQRANIPTAPQVRPAKPNAQVKPQVQPQTKAQSAVQAGARPTGVPNHENGYSQAAQRPQTAPAMQKPPARNPQGFAIPGQETRGAVKPLMPPVPTQPAAKNNGQGEKKMTLFGLLSHYNKANADLYKKQKEAKKAASAAKPAQRPMQPPVQAAQNGVPMRPSGAQRPPMGAPMQQQFNNQRPQAPVQNVARPVPVQNSFNETTVLSQSMLGGETTVLNSTPVGPNPQLTRVKSGEKISINKPVFRIGKEKSYVDYFIADNTAISRSHANIHTENGEYFIEDTNSTNHTYINGKLITSNVKTQLAAGDKVRLANEDFIFTI